MSTQLVAVFRCMQAVVPAAPTVQSRAQMSGICGGFAMQVVPVGQLASPAHEYEQEFPSSAEQMPWHCPAAGQVFPMSVTFVGGGLRQSPMPGASSEHVYVPSAPQSVSVFGRQNRPQTPAVAPGSAPWQTKFFRRLQLSPV